MTLKLIAGIVLWIALFAVGFFAGCAAGLIYVLLKVG